MWVYDNVRRGASVLDIGCGAGVLALLKRKGVVLTGVDLSGDCAATALRNGYDIAKVGELTALPFADQSFDYVVSLDVLGHVEFADKDQVLAEIKRVLKPNGVTLHGIETMNREQQKDYHEMTPAELRDFVNVDGHVGMESESAIKERFLRFFPYVATAARYRICQPCDGFTKLSDEYEMAMCDPDFLEYVRGLSFIERRAFNMAMGYVFDRLSEFGVKLPSSGYTYVKAAQVPLGSFYREHGEREDLFPQPIHLHPGATVSLDATTHAAYDGGWYDAEMFPPLARWMGLKAGISFRATHFRKMVFDIVTHIPDAATWPVRLEFRLNGDLWLRRDLSEPGWQTIELEMADKSRETPPNTYQEYDLEIRADRTWRPNSTNPDSTDDRELSVAVGNVKLIG
jgi:ubiquinone/menaquinone biosynthesis C-methylase UbiE